MDLKETLLKKTVGIAGCGGLGSNCAVALARVGVGKLIIADFDIVVESNLNRQYFFYNQIGKKKCDALKENISLINPFIEVSAYDIKLDPESIIRLFSSCDVIVEAFDLAQMKQMIIETVLTQLPKIPIVSGIGLAAWGNSNSLHVEKSNQLIICGDQLTEVSESLPPLAPRVGIVANMQANEILEILLGKII